MSSIHRFLCLLVISLTISASSFSDSVGQDADVFSTPESIFARCVQSSLDTLGFSVGPVDGIIGRLTRRAIAEYIRKYPEASSQPALSVQTTPDWCEYLSANHEQVAEAYPQAKAAAQRIPEIRVVSGDPRDIWVELSSQTDGSVEDALKTLLDERSRESILGNGKQNALLFVFRDGIEIGDKITVEHRFERPWNRNIPPTSFEYTINESTPLNPLIIMNSTSTQGRGGTLTLSLFHGDELIARKVIPITR